MTIDMNHPKYFDPFLKTLEVNTDKNYHTENAVLIAANFGTDRHKKDMKLIADIQERDGYLNSQSSLARYYLLKDILSNVKEYLKFWGVSKVHKGLAKKIYKRL
tara:strand:+ start:698 stop:1009 length:312 start_codon:yes stop_codon:yes gene_type:complete